MPHPLDKKARTILFDTYWKGGWIPAPRTDPADLAYAQAQGLMFAPVTLSHDECLSQLLECRDRLPARTAGRAFVASLASRRLDWRSALASHACAQALAPHHYDPVESGRSYGADGTVVRISHTCGHCRDAKDGIIGNEHYAQANLDVLNFERLKWGGVRHGQLLYTWLDLRLLAVEDIPEPGEEDRRILRDLLAAIAASEAGELASTLEKRLKDLLPSTKDERRMLIEILACAGVLRAADLDRPARGKSDWRYASDWRGEDGYCAETAAAWFGPWLA